MATARKEFLFSDVHCCFSPGFRLNKVVSLLEQLLRSSGLKEILLAQCNTRSATDVPLNDLVTCLVTVPDRVINKLHTQARLGKESIIVHNSFIVKILKFSPCS